jgi:NADH-quinone oxidoreductase subunit M
MFENIPILPLLLVVPLIGALLTFAVGKNPKVSKYMALAFSGITLVLATLLTMDFSLSAPLGTEFQFEVRYDWVPMLGISFHLGVDGISILMVFLSALLVFLAILFSWDVEERTGTYMGLMLLLDLGVLGVFMALDYFLFYIFWEVVLIPMFFLIAIWGGPNRAYASIKFFIYTHVASLVMLLGIFALVFTAQGPLGGISFDMADIATVSGDFGHAIQVLIYAALFFGFIVKMPMVPFHTWLPDAACAPPRVGSACRPLLKMGSYGIIRICVWTFPNITLEAQVLIAVLGVVSMIYGAFACLAQTDLKKMVAYSSISHMGIVLLGIATMTDLGMAAAVFQMFAHGLIRRSFHTCGMFQTWRARERYPPGRAGPQDTHRVHVMMTGFMASSGLPPGGIMPVLVLPPPTKCSSCGC